uniref:Uncharacterized protein n=1 Tax=Arundo donax TaxID=35708 RepID=A0A0A9AES8_ARUDO
MIMFLKTSYSKIFRAYLIVCKFASVDVEVSIVQLILS